VYDDWQKPAGSGEDSDSASATSATSATSAATTAGNAVAAAKGGGPRRPPLLPLVEVGPIETTVLLIQHASDSDTAVERVINAIITSSQRIVIFKQMQLTRAQALDFVDESVLEANRVNVTVNTAVDRLCTSVCDVVVFSGPNAVARCLAVSGTVHSDGLDQNADTETMVLASPSALFAEVQMFVCFAPQGEFRGALFEVEDADQHMPAYSQQSALVQSGLNGFFYPVYVVEHLSSMLYVIEEQSGRLHTADIADFMVQSEWAQPDEVGEAVLAPHPRYVDTYAPAFVTLIEQRHGIGRVVPKKQQGFVAYHNATLRFFDNTVDILPVGSCVAVSQEQHAQVVQCIALAKSR